MADVFLSYKKEDVTIADRVVAALRAQGLAVWWDESLTARVAWDADLEREIAAASAVVVLWTPRSVASDWVRTEAHYGQDHGKLIPVMMESCTVPLAFMLRQTVNLCDWQAELEHRQWRKLLAWIADLTAAKSGSTNASPAAGAAPAHAFHETVGHLASGHPIVDGAFVNASTPAGTAFRDAADLPVMRIVPHGAFMLGSPATDPDRSTSEGPQKRIEIPAPFAMGAFPVLVSEYKAVTGADPTPGDLIPVTNLSFDDALQYVASLSSKTGESYRLPSETEWEYACRAGSRSRYSCGDVIDATKAAFGLRAGPVATESFPPNAFGLYDMHGNVREWTADLWHESYELTPLDGSPATDGHSSMRVVRGGGWSDSASMLRSAARMRATQSIRVNVIGLRVVRALN